MKKITLTIALIGSLALTVSAQLDPNSLKLTQHFLSSPSGSLGSSGSGSSIVDPTASEIKDVHPGCCHDFGARPNKKRTVSNTIAE